MTNIKDLYFENKNKLGEISRFIITGIASTIITYLIYYVGLLWFPATISFSCGYIVAMFANYLLTTAFTFKVKASAKNAVGFLISNGINYMLCALFLNVFIWLGVDKKLAPVPMYAVCIPINYLLVRYIMKK